MRNPIPMPATRPRDLLVLMVGVFASSLSVIFIKDSTSHPIWLSGIRLLVAAVFLTPLFVIHARKNPTGVSAQQIMRSFPGGVMLAVHFITWAMGARLTYAINGTLIVNLATVALPFIMWGVNHERINRREIIGSLIALLGVVILVGGRLQISGQNVRGDLLCFVSMILYCFYIAFGRRNGMGRSLWLYVVPLYYISGVMCVSIALLTPGIPLPPISMHEVAMLICLGLIPTVIGHSIMNWCIKSMRGQVVSTANLFQFGFAGISGYLIFNEKPSLLLYPMCVLIIIGSLIVIRAHRSSVDVDAES